MTKTILIGIIALTFVAGAGTAYAGIVLPTITLAGDVTITGDTTLQGELICTDCIDAQEIHGGAVGSSEIAPGAVGSLHIGDFAVGPSEIQNNAVGPFKIQTNAVRSSEIADNAVGNAEMKDNAIGSAEIAGGAVGFSEIDVTITTWDAVAGGDIPMIPVDGKSFCALLRARALDSSTAECDIDFGGLANWELQSNTAGAVCQAICIQFG